MKTKYEYACDLGINDKPKQCPNCKTRLVWTSIEDLSSAYTHHRWYCGNCGSNVSNLVYGNKKH